MQKTVWFQILKLNVQMSSWIIKHIPGTIDIKKTKMHEEKIKAHQYEAIEGQSSLFLGYNQYNHNSKEKLFYLNTSSKRN